MEEKKPKKKESKKASKKTDKKEAKKDKEEVCETFEVEKQGEEKPVRVCEMQEKKHSSEEGLKKNEEILKYFLIGLGIFTIATILTAVFIYQAKSFEYRGVSFDRDVDGEITFYHTSFPLVKDGKNLIYNIWIRNLPSKLENNFPFEGELNVKSLIVMNYTDEIMHCGGKGTIALANMINMYDILNIKTVRDINATCDPRYTYINFKKGNETKIVQTGDSCYEFIISDCEVIEVTERFIIEELVKINEQLN